MSSSDNAVLVVREDLAVHLLSMLFCFGMLRDVPGAGRVGGGGATCALLWFNGGWLAAHVFSPMVQHAGLGLARPNKRTHMRHALHWASAAGQNARRTWKGNT